MIAAPYWTVLAVSESCGFIRPLGRVVSYVEAEAIAADWRLEAQRAVDHAEVHVMQARQPTR